MTKKEREELERKQRKKNKTKNIIIFILVIALIVLLAVFLFKQGIITLGEKETTTQNPADSVSDLMNEGSSNNSGIYIDSNTTDDEESTSEDEKDEISSEEPETKESENTINNGDKVYAASLPLTVDDAIAILHSRYGNDYRINRSTAGEGYTNFAVFKDDERYATVSVNLSTGEATEIITDTGKQTKFNLL